MLNTLFVIMVNTFIEIIIYILIYISSLYYDKYDLLLTWLVGEDVVPVADCSKQGYGTHPKTEMKFTEFLSRMGGGDCCLYLKDYHFVR